MNNKFYFIYESAVCSAMVFVCFAVA